MLSGLDTRPSPQTQGEVRALADKTLRHRFDTATSKKAIPRVRAWAWRHALVRGQGQVDEKSAAMTALPL